MQPCCLSTEEGNGYKCWYRYEVLKPVLYKIKLEYDEAATMRPVKRTISLKTCSPSIFSAYTSKIKNTL